MSFVIEVLPASGSVTSDDLDAAVFRRIDSDFGPSRRDSQLSNAREILLRGLAAVSAPITKAALRRSHSQNAVRMNPLSRVHEDTEVQKSGVRSQESGM